MKNYVYRQKNNSILSNGFINAFVKPLSSVVPARFPANYISIFSHLSIYLALYFSYEEELLGRSTFVFIPFLVLIHLLTNKLDGAQARVTKTESGLGEFLDHYFEIFNYASMIFLIWNLFDITHEWVLLCMLTLSMLISIVKYYEQYKTNWLIFGRIGSFELKVMVMLVILLCHYLPIFTFFNQPDLSTYSLAEGLLLLVSMGILINVIRTMIRIPDITYGLWLFITLFLMVAGLSPFIFDPLLSGIIIVFYGAAYAGKLMIAQLVDGVERSPGLFAPIMLLIHFFTNYFHSTYIFFILFIYLLISILLLIIKTFRVLKSDWYWLNPTMPKGEQENRRRE